MKARCFGAGLERVATAHRVAASNYFQFAGKRLGCGETVGILKVSMPRIMCSMLAVTFFAGTASAGDMSWYNSMRLYQEHKSQQAQQRQLAQQRPQGKRTNTEVMDYHFTFGRNAFDGSTQAERAQVALVTTDEIGPFPRGKGLYVRWKVKSTHKVYEDAVNLESLLPSSNQSDDTYIPEGFTISFKVKGPQLYVYLHINHGETRQIYPESTQ